MSDNVKYLSDADFDKEVLQDSGAVIVDFWAVWCPPCRAIAPLMDELADSYKGKVKICKLNVDENNASAQRYNVMSIPTIIAFKDGKEQERITGAMVPAIRAMVEKYSK